LAEKFTFSAKMGCKGTMGKAFANSQFAAKLALKFRKEENYVPGFYSYGHRRLRRTLQGSEFFSAIICANPCYLWQKKH
jgi:hypothetical protein